ncbi:TKL/DRK protein kinase, partial [Phytophthora palmivora]
MDEILPKLVACPDLVDKRISIQSLHYKVTLSNGASGEVWLGQLNDQQVAVKQLLRTYEHTLKDVDEFVDEIVWTASLSHLHIVSFIGVAWSSLDNVAMVMEYCPMGDLKRFLAESGRLLSWSRDKARMAVGIAQALRYIHERKPPIIHRDLKSTNILLTETLETKISDFGVSRSRKHGFMTAGVGTPYWIAPEILEGKRYTEQADIYSFGVVLSELDTCKMPFSDVLTAEGKKPKPFQILHWVLEGRLTPAFSEDCPRWIRSVGTQCLQHDPGLRPTAAELTQVLWTDVRHRIYTLTADKLAVMRVSGFLAILAATSTMAQDYTITFRSLEENDPSSASLPSDTAFKFDGTNSNIAQQLYIRHKAGDTATAVSINSIPTSVTDRLKALKVTFDTLPGLVQRAVLWDTGFAISPGGDPVQIWPIGDYTMADIAVPQNDITKVNCTMLECGQPNGVPAYSSQYCSGTQILNVSRCVADTFEDSGATDFLGVMWSTGGDAAMTPHIRLRDHTWTEPTTGISYNVYAVHTISSADDPTWNQCPANDGYSSLIVPCRRRIEFTDAEIAGMKKPTGSIWVTTWLKEEFARDDSGFDELLLIPIVLVVIAALGIGLFCWKRTVMMRREQAFSYDFDVVSPHYLDVVTHEQAFRPTVTTSTYGPSVSSHPDDYESAGSNQTFKILLQSKHLHGNRIPYDALRFQTEISKGASGEVWICLYGGQQVAVKELLHTKDQKADDVQAFAEEIELTASLIHPHIVKFVGVAWNSLNNLAMVLEYVPMGNLKDYLHKNSDLMSWARDKIHMAIAVAEALEYLHSRTPAIIHRDLKSNNILLSESLEPKLIDFGVSRGMMDLTMTAGVGTPYWTAPEILEGDRYTEKADIYSFGVVLSELDTGRLPYFDAVVDDGTKMKPFQILEEVMSGILRP